MFAQWEFVDATVSLPFSKAASKVILSTGCGLVSFLSSFSEELHDDCGDRRRDIIQPRAVRLWLSGDVAVHPFHRIGRREGKTAAQHFVNRNTKSIEVAPRIDGTIHLPRLLEG